MSTYGEYEAHAGPLPELRGVLNSWIEVQRKYGRRMGWADATWLYNERAALSALAAAVWCAGGIALEEYATRKLARLGSTGRLSRRYHPGRCDLFFRVGARDYICEAKPSWPSLSSRAPTTAIIDRLEQARADVRRTETYSGARRLAVVLVAPTLPERSAANGKLLVDRLAEELRGMTDCARAWTFPRSARTAFHAQGRYYIGAAILLKPLRR